ncbi:hypothetical protein LOC68_02675 [Blastopirellula sp. JC732]|uniref:Proteophosphoglycan 5 n=1 Tax=Blastopirellula sediminis TaxID=2894196 RepID=A0A9X1MHN0_9BACT|nr:hypothetical protein [Blastopirellula sediminis]MCC9607919.1 hypothetical protein [Blastopirellula sediminis]MCC9627288.1 hypothetical protein [Blastopirellula sediminis]
MPLIDLDLPSPAQLRGGWAAFAAVCAARGWTDSAYAEPDRWYFDDGGGNWACLRFHEGGRAILFGHDHEYSETYFRDAATYFDEEETDLLADAPEWWGFDLDPAPYGDFIGFVYGWDGTRWRRSAYDKSDGFESVGLLDGCSINGFQQLADHAADAPGLNGEPPAEKAMAALVAADGEITSELLAAVTPGWDIAAGVAAARKFRDAVLR